MKRIIGMVVAILGVATLVLGILFLMQANTSKQDIADDIAPIAISDVNAKYDQVRKAQVNLMATEEPKIQAGSAAPSTMYMYLSGQRALLGLAKTNLKTVAALQFSGIIEIVVGCGLVLTGLALVRKEVM